jgi:phospholipase C
MNTRAPVDVASLATQKRLTRRQLLSNSARAAVTAAASMLMPPNVRRMLAKDLPSRGSLRDVKHVVVLMQENRSFDHYFGTLAGVRGFDDPKALMLPNGRSVFYQPDSENPNGYLLPFHLDTHATSAQKIPSTSHAWAVQHAAWNGGRMDKWLEAHRKADGRTGRTSWVTIRAPTFHFSTRWLKRLQFAYSHQQELWSMGKRRQGHRNRTAKGLD